MKKIKALIAVALMGAGLTFVASPAHAVSSVHTSCFAPLGGTFSMDIYYTKNGAGNVQFNYHVWSTSPAFKADRVTVSSRVGPNDGWTLEYAMGYDSSSQDDVATSGSANDTAYAGSATQVRMTVFNSNLSCNGGAVNI